MEQKEQKNKIRLDLLMTEKGMTPNRTKAQALIMSGVVKVNGVNITKAGTLVSPHAAVEIIKPAHPYVGRGGLKLEEALKEMDIDVTGFVSLDAGASTGGFTDCLLQKGAVKVYAVDVGYGQIHQKLRDDPRVIVIEKCNVRYLTPAQVPEKVNLITADLSFISLEKVLAKLMEFLLPDGIIIALIKPQFEAPRKQSRKGVIKDDEAREKAVEKVIDYAESIGLSLIKVVKSPIKGPKGNQEYPTGFRMRSQLDSP